MAGEDKKTHSMTFTSGFLSPSPATRAGSPTPENLVVAFECCQRAAFDGFGLVGADRGRRLIANPCAEIAEMAAESLPESLSSVASGETMHTEDHGLYIINVLKHHDALIAITVYMRELSQKAESRMAVEMFFVVDRWDKKRGGTWNVKLQGSPVAEPWHPRP